jgi:hypothetical protein
MPSGWRQRWHWVLRALALEAAAARPMVIATAAAVASATRRPRRPPYPGLIMMLPSDGEPVGVIAERGVQMLAEVVGYRRRRRPSDLRAVSLARTRTFGERPPSTSSSLGSGSRQVTNRMCPGLPRTYPKGPSVPRVQTLRCGRLESSRIRGLGFASRKQTPDHNLLADAGVPSPIVSVFVSVFVSVVSVRRRLRSLTTHVLAGQSPW